MTNELKNLRLMSGVKASQMVEVVRELYPKYDKTIQSKCERAGEYGISIQPDAIFPGIWDSFGKC